MASYIVFDLETNGLVEKEDNKYPKPYMIEKYPEIISFSWIIVKEGKITKKRHNIIKQWPTFIYNQDAGDVHNISLKEIREHGVMFNSVIFEFFKDLKTVDLLVGYNIWFDYYVLLSGLYRYMVKKSLRDFRKEINNLLFNINKECCMLKDYKLNCRDKWQKLSILYSDLFNGEVFNAHNSLADCIATHRIFEVLNHSV